MTKQELNKDMKFLWTRFQRRHDKKGDAYFEAEKYMRNELKRIYQADDMLVYLNHKNLRRMILMNVSIRAITLHHFGSGISSDKTL
tara:strand:- start:1074 stop:1331 length:258 start_codon:yes stop_codon:yes gene_type:complete